MANWHKTKTLILIAAVLLTSSVTLPVSAYTQEDLNKINAKISALRGEIANYEQKGHDFSPNSTLFGWK